MSIRSTKKFAAVAALAMSTVAASTASAALISFRFDGTGSGTLNGQAFGNSAFTINAQGDTTGWATNGNGTTWVANSAASITIAGLGTYSFLLPTGTWTQAGQVGFGRLNSNGVYGSNLFTVTSAPGVESWDRVSSFGPATSPWGQLIQWNTVAIATSGGTLFFNTSFAVPNAVFEATVVPAPGAIALLGLAGRAGRRRR